MKPFAKVLACLLPLLFVYLFGFSCQQTRIPKWLPDQGNWMVESNIKSPLHSVIYFYTNDGIVIYKETIDGIHLDVTKKKVKMRLKKVLAEALVAWNQNKQVLEEQEWLVCLFKKLN